MHIHTTRCLIRPFEAKDLDDFITYRNDLDWMKHQGFKGLSREDYQQALLREQVWQDGAQFAIALRDSNQLIGDIYLKEEKDRIWIGYTITPVFARQGYAGEAVQGVAAYLKAAGHTYVYAGVESDNIASINLLEHLGFTFITIDEHGEKTYCLALNK